MDLERHNRKKVAVGIVQIGAFCGDGAEGGNFVVLPRQYPENAPVHADLVRQLDELTREEACKRGIFVVTGRFTEEAKNISKKLAIDLVDGPKFSEILEGPAYDGRWTLRIVDERGEAT